MQKILFLDWDGPISNSRTWKMPGFVDPVAIQLLNDATKAGWKTCLSSTIRKKFGSIEEATKFMNKVGFYPEWATVWRTDLHYTARRHVEIANHLMSNDYEDDTIFLVVDDERIPFEMLKRGRIKQIEASAHLGIGYLSISEAYRYFAMNDEQLEEEFSVEGELDGR